MAYKDIPSLSQWRKDSSVAFAVRKDDIVLKRIDQLIEHLHVARYKFPTRYLTYLSDLYFTADYWLKTCESNRAMEKGRVKAMYDLFAAAAFRLCDTFQCTITSLPNELELMWGRELTAHAVERDLKHRHAEYITRAEAAKYKLYFKHGRAHQFPWWDETREWRRVLAESHHAFDEKAFVVASRKPGARSNMGYGFFVLTMSRDIYMYKHRVSHGPRAGMCPVALQGFYHSAYTAGEPVMCAGTMLIEAGVIRRIRFDSGHYMPTINNARALVMALRMFGVPLERVDFEDFNGHLLGFDEAKEAVGQAQDADIGTLQYVLRQSDEAHLQAGRAAGLDKNQKAHDVRRRLNPPPAASERTSQYNAD